MTTNKNPASTGMLDGVDSKITRDDAGTDNTTTANVQAEEMLALALDCAVRGWHVFPCSPADKKPLIKHGFKGATTDAAIIRKFWRQHPTAMIGVACGEKSGCWCLDPDAPTEKNPIDGRENWRALQAEHDPIEPTHTHVTPGGGRHLIFAWRTDRTPITNREGALKGKHVNVRGEGGYFIAAGSVNSDGVAYTMADDANYFRIALAPDWLHDLIDGKAATLPIEQDQYQAATDPRTITDRVLDSMADGTYQHTNSTGTGYAKAALTKECAELASTGIDRNIRLNDAALSLGRFVKSGELSESEVISALMAACDTNGLNKDDGRAASLATIKSGMGAAIARVIPIAGTDSHGTSSTGTGTGTGSTGSSGVELTDFYAYMPTHQYIFTPTREMWPGTSVDSRFPPVPVLKKDGTPALDANGKARYSKPSSWLDVHRPVEQMTWAPGEPLVISDRLISEGGWIAHIGITTFNLYRPPTIKPGDASKATRWVDLMQEVYPDDAEHIMDFFAHRVQKPQEKINHGLVLGGDQGIGKDTLVEGLKEAVGPWNCKEASPQDVMGTYNDFMRSVVLRISEARDLGEVNKFAFYEHMKTVQATPPDVVRVNAKYIPQHYVLNRCGVIFTTNNKTDCLYLPPDDRRTYVAWSNLKKEYFADGYWIDFYDWYQKQKGFEHVAAFLAERDISKFDAKAPPKKTAAFWTIVDTGMPLEQSELADVIDEIEQGGGLAKKPPQNVDALTLKMINDCAVGSFFEWLQDRKNRRAIPRRFERCGYTPVRNPDVDDGLWVIKGKRQVIYARSSLSVREQFSAAQALVKAVS